MAYIKRKDAINEVLTLRDYSVNNEEKVAFSLVYKKLRELPTADVVEVVRCKDCKHWNCASNRTEHMECDIFCGCYGRGYATNPDDFCSYGERRDT